MLIQRSLPSSIEAALSFVSDDRKQDLSCDWIPSDDIWQKCPKSVGSPSDGCRKSSSSSREEQENATDSQYLIHSRTCLKLSTTSNMCVGSSPNSSSNLVYKRRKLQSNSFALLSAQATTSTKDSGGCISSMSSKDNHFSSQTQNETDSARVSDMAGGACNGDFLFNGNSSIFEKSFLHKFDDSPCTKIKKKRDMETVSKLESIDGCSGGEEHRLGKDPNIKPASEYGSMSGIITISSSKSNTELGSGGTKVDIEDTGECSSSFISLAENLSEKELCISILRSHGLLGKPLRSFASIDLLSIHDDTNRSQSCKTCNRSENSLNMLICDNCEDAFHVSCCNPRIKKIPVGEWNCQACSRKKHKCSQESKKSVNAKSESSKSRNGTSKNGANCIASMLTDKEPYTTGVRIGKAFQADIPDWSGPISEDYDCLGEPLEMDPREHSSLHGWNLNRSFTPNSVGNWLQCREVLRDSAGERAGTICGKWRRAPLFKIQTDDWDCSCAVVWDPIHADCSVPQELATDQVLTHLKYVELLRPRLAARKRKVSPSQSETGS